MLCKNSSLFTKFSPSAKHYARFYMDYFIKFSHVTEKPYEADYFTHFTNGEIGALEVKYLPKDTHLASCQVRAGTKQCEFKACT